MALSSELSRRRLIGGAAAAAAVAFPMVNFGEFRLRAASSRSYSGRAVDLVRQSLVIDMLSPIKLDFRPEFFSAPMTDEDAADFRASGISAIHHAAGVSGPDAFPRTLEFLTTWYGFVARNPHVLSLVGKAADIETAKRVGKCAVIMGIQNADHFRTPEDVKLFHDLGLRSSQLTYNSQNRLGSGSTERVDGGLTDFGASIIDAMNAVGMLVDVSHCGDRTTLDAISASAKPIAITHSNCRALNDHPRLKTDEAIKALAAKGGVMGITGVRNFVREKEPTTIAHLVDHIDHVVGLVGIDHIGIGSDADLNGYDDMEPVQYKWMRDIQKPSYRFREKLDTDAFDHPMKFYDLTEELLRRGYPKSSISAILGGNFRRLLGSIWP